MKITRTISNIEITQEEMEALEVLAEANRQCNELLDCCGMCPFRHSKGNICICSEASKLLQLLKRRD